jgi:hypothetical protein
MLYFSLDADDLWSYPRPRRKIVFSSHSSDMVRLRVYRPTIKMPSTPRYYGQVPQELTETMCLGSENPGSSRVTIPGAGEMPGTLSRLT